MTTNEQTTEQTAVLNEIEGILRNPKYRSEIDLSCRQAVAMLSHGEVLGADIRLGALDAEVARCARIIRFAHIRASDAMLTGVILLSNDVPGAVMLLMACRLRGISSLRDLVHTYGNQAVTSLGDGGEITEISKKLLATALGSGALLYHPPVVRMSPFSKEALAAGLAEWAEAFKGLPRTTTPVSEVHLACLDSALASMDNTAEGWAFLQSLRGKDSCTPQDFMMRLYESVMLEIYRKLLPEAGPDLFAALAVSSPSAAMLYMSILYAYHAGWKTRQDMPSWITGDVPVESQAAIGDLLHFYDGLRHPTSLASWIES